MTDKPAEILALVDILAAADLGDKVRLARRFALELLAQRSQVRELLPPDAADALLLSAARTLRDEPTEDAVVAPQEPQEATNKEEEL